MKMAMGVSTISPSMRVGKLPQKVKMWALRKLICELWMPSVGSAKLAVNPTFDWSCWEWANVMLGATHRFWVDRGIGVPAHRLCCRVTERLAAGDGKLPSNNCMASCDNVVFLNRLPFARCHDASWTDDRSGGLSFAVNGFSAREAMGEAWVMDLK
jgi:hypothetical protein